MNLPDTPIEVIGYDSEEGITPIHNGKQLLIFVDGQERIVTQKFYDPVKGFIQTETVFYIPKELI